MNQKAEAYEQMVSVFGDQINYVLQKTCGQS